MTSARTGSLASLREMVGRLEVTNPGQRRVLLGHKPADSALKGGLALGVLHEVFAQQERQGAAATGFTLALVRRVTENRRFVLWIRQDCSALRAGELAMTGFAELGLDPRYLVVVQAANAEMALRTAADGLGCNGFGAIVTELWGEPKAFDAVASRKLTLAATSSGVTGLMLRLAAHPNVSTAETRWIVRAAHSPPGPAWRAWGEPVFDAELIRNRHGPTGRWIMQWNCDDHLFHDQNSYGHLLRNQPPHEGPPHSQPVVSKVADRSLPATTPAGPGRLGGQRRA